MTFFKIKQMMNDSQGRVRPEWNNIMNDFTKVCY